MVNLDKREYRIEIGEIERGHYRIDIKTPGLGSTFEQGPHFHILQLTQLVFSFCKDAENPMVVSGIKGFRPMHPEDFETLKKYIYNRSNIHQEFHYEILPDSDTF